MTAYYNALRKAGLLKRDENTQIVTLHPQVLRKFFRTRMAPVISIDTTEALMGHEGYLTQAYRRYTPHQLAQEYKRGENTLLINGDLGDISKIRIEAETSSKVLQAQINHMTEDIISLKQQHKRELDEINDTLGRIFSGEELVQGVSKSQSPKQSNGSAYEEATTLQREIHESTEPIIVMPWYRLNLPEKKEPLKQLTRRT